MSTSKQRQLISQLAAFANISSTEASNYLKRNNWNVDSAAEAYLTSSKKTNTVTALNKIFDKYKDPNSDEIGIDGTIKYIQDLGLELEDPIVLAIAYTLGSPGMGRFPREEFIKGWGSEGADSINGMKNAVQRFRERFENDPQFFKQVYRFTFGFNLQEGQRILNIDTAVAYWDLLLRSKYDKLDIWITFVTQEYKKNISRDTWNMLLDFIEYHKTDPSLKEYDEEGAWPSIIDEFVEYLKAKE